MGDRNVICRSCLNDLPFPSINHLLCTLIAQYTATQIIKRRKRIRERERERGGGGRERDGRREGIGRGG